MKPHPPKRALQFLRWFCREDYIEEIEGDLTEVFAKQHGVSPGKAKVKFIWSVLRYLRPQFIKSFRTSFHLTPIAMFRHNFLIAFRNLRRYKSSFVVNLTGLSTGLACALLIVLWVNDELSVDKFHEKKDRIYRVLKNQNEEDGVIHTSDRTPTLTAQSMSDELPEIEYATAIVKRDKGIISTGNNHVKAMHIFADKNFFKVFTYRLIKGNKPRRPRINTGLWCRTSWR